MQCPNCKGIVPDTARVCGYCGYRLADAPQPAAQPVDSSQPRPLTPAKRTIPRWIWLLVVLAVLMLCALLVILWLRPRQGGGTQLPAVYSSPSPAQPTPTVIIEATRADCTLLTYEVQQNDTLDAIAAVFNIPPQKIRIYNRLSSDAISPGMILSLPLCEQVPQTELTPTTEMSIAMTPVIVTLQPDASQFNKVFGQPGDCNSFKVSQEDYPGGVMLPPNTVISKTWTLLNLGSCTWTTDYSIVAVTDEIMGGEKAIFVWVDSPPGSGIEFTIDFISPAQEGSYEAVWGFRDGEGVEFGRLSFLMVVQNP